MEGFVEGFIEVLGYVGLICAVVAVTLTVVTFISIAISKKEK